MARSDKRKATDEKFKRKTESEMYGNNQDIINKLNETKQHQDGSRIPFLEEGTYLLGLAEFGEYVSKKKGHAIGGTFVVFESSNPKHQPGSLATRGYYPNRQPYFVGEEVFSKEMTMCAEMVGALHGIPQFDAQKAKIAEMLSGECQSRQTYRGAMVRAIVTKQTSAKGKSFVEIAWAPVPGQNAQTVAAQCQQNRARIEGTDGMRALAARKAQQAQQAQNFQTQNQQAVQSGQPQWQQPGPGNFTQQPPQNAQPAWGQQPAQIAQGQTWGQPAPGVVQPSTTQGQPAQTWGQPAPGVVQPSTTQGQPAPGQWGSGGGYNGNGGGQQPF